MTTQDLINSMEKRAVIDKKMAKKLTEANEYRGRDAQFQDAMDNAFAALAAWDQKATGSGSYRACFKDTICGAAVSICKFAKKNRKKKLIKSAVLNKFSLEIKNINERVNSVKLPVFKVNAKAALEGVISVYEEGFEQIRLKNNDRANAFIKAAEEKLSKLKSAIANVGDIGSQNAAKYEQEIFNCLQNALKGAFLGQYNTTELANLDTALEAANQWVATVITEKSKSAEEGDILDKNALPDAIVVTATYPLKQNKVADLKVYLKDMENNVASSVDIDAMKEEKAALMAKKTEYENTMRELDYKYENGMLDVDDYLSEQEDCQRDFDRCNEEIADINSQIDNSKDFAYANKDLMAGINLIVKKIEQYAATPVNYCYLADNLNVDLIIDYMNYPDDTKKLKIMSICDRISIIEQDMLKAASLRGDTRGILNQRSRDKVSVGANTNGAQTLDAEAEKRRKADELLAKRKQMQANNSRNVNATGAPQATEATPIFRSDKNANIDDN